MKISIFVAVFLLACVPISVFAESLPKVSYTALSDAAKNAGRLKPYRDVEMTSGKIELGGSVLEYEIPKKVGAYDLLPVRYKLERADSSRPTAVEAVAFEEDKKLDGRTLYDMNVPGNLDMEIEYLGSICGEITDDYVYLTADPKGPKSPFPPYKLDELVRSGNIRAKDVVWFKFRVTNTGNTIWDPEGFGACFAHPLIAKIGPDGKEEWSASTINRHERFEGYIYPGESWDLWANFYCPALGLKNNTLVPGDYRIDFRMVYRDHRRYDWWINKWTGREFCRLTIPITVSEEGADEPVKTELKVVDDTDKMPGIYSKFEEFMTALAVYDDDKTQVEDTIYLQVAPWTEHVTIKLIHSGPMDIATARLPLEVSTEDLAIEYNPKNVMVETENGKETPVIVAQEMPGMRIGIQLGPYPEKHMRKRMELLKSLGINVIANTSGGWWIGEVGGVRRVGLLAAQYKYWYDDLMSEYDMKGLGWSVYPPSNPTFYDHVTELIGKKVEYARVDKGYFSYRHSVDVADPIVPEVIAAWTIYNNKRWGEWWFVTKDGRVPIDIEDTWGWLRDDINLRYELGDLGLQQFRKWAEEKYGSIEKVNEAWGSQYLSFEQIDPQKDQGIEGHNLTHGPVFNKMDHVFHDWSPATRDLDIFRTELRMQIYEKALELIRKEIPKAEFCLRTEGANFPIRADGGSENMHWRHIFYSQRRNAMIYDIWEREDVIAFHSDYTTMPYTLEEWRKANREMVADGITPMYLPQFDHMRDVLLNDHYGRDYKLHYNLDESKKGLMVHCLMAAYPWWKITYEEGGAPGIIFSDYACDGFATVTQQKELRLLRDQFDTMEKRRHKKE